MSDLTVTLVQSDLTWEAVDANLALFDTEIDAIEQSTELIVLPEMFSTGFSMHPENLAEPMTGKAVTWLRHKAKSKGAMVTGSKEAVHTIRLDRKRLDNYRMEFPAWMDQDSLFDRQDC